MRFPKRKLIRAVEDYHVDRTEVEAQQCVELTGTNRPRTWQLTSVARARCVVLEVSGIRRLQSVSVAIAEGRHPVPYRTRKLSPPAPMVLPGKLGGRVGRRRDSSRSAACGRRFVVPGVPRRRRALPPPRTARCAREGHRGRPPQPPEPSRPIRAPRPRRLETWHVPNPPQSRPAPLRLPDRPLERPRHRRSHRPSWSDVRAERPRRRTPPNR